MLFRAAATIALLAATVAAEAQPYKLNSGPIPGLSLARRDTYGYQPEQSVCGAGDTCAEACGTGFETCASNDGNTHCFNPTAKQSCCTDGTGNSCDEGYYCTHDAKMNTWCCPDNLNLVQCAAKFNVDGDLETDAPATTSAKPTSTSISTSTSTSIAIPTTSTSSKPTSTPIYEAVISTTSTTVKVTSTYVTPTTKSDVVKTKLKEYTTTVCPTPISSHGSGWVGSNSTITNAAPTHPYGTPVASNPAGTTVSTVPTGAAAASGVSALLLVAAGLVALL